MSNARGFNAIRSDDSRKQHILLERAFSWVRVKTASLFFSVLVAQGTKTHFEKLNNFRDYLEASSVKMKGIVDIKDNDFLKIISYVRPSGASNHFHVNKWWKIMVGVNLFKYFNVVHGILRVSQNSSDTENVMTFFAKFQKEHDNKKLHDLLLKTLHYKGDKRTPMFVKFTADNNQERKDVWATIVPTSIIPAGDRKELCIITMAYLGIHYKVALRPQGSGMSTMGLKEMSDWLGEGIRRGGQKK